MMVTLRRQHVVVPVAAGRSVVVVVVIGAAASGSVAAVRMIVVTGNVKRESVSYRNIRIVFVIFINSQTFRTLSV